MIRPLSPRFAVYLGIVFLFIGLLQLGASLMFYQSIDRQTLRDDHARRVAELLVVSDRVHMLSDEGTGSIMTTRHLTAAVADVPLVANAARDPVLADIAARIVAWEPSLAGRSLALATANAGPGSGSASASASASGAGPRPATGGKDLVGSIRLADGRWLNFRSEDISTMWPVALRATALTMATTAAALAIGLIALHLLTAPLRRLTDAAESIGQGRAVTIAERGPKDLRDLAHAMNVMQQRIARLLQDQAKAFEAISHDLRTPLARQKVVADLIHDAELADIVCSSVDEMDDLLASLQVFLRAQHLAASPEPIDLGPFLRDLLHPFGDKLQLLADDAPVLRTFREPLAMATCALVENAIQFGESASVRVAQVAGHWTITVADSGPGIPADYHEAILEPFFRLDEARRRDTRGFGLGIPTAHRLMMRFGGDLHFAASETGGLAASLRVPVA